MNTKAIIGVSILAVVLLVTVSFSSVMGCCSVKAASNLEVASNPTYHNEDNSPIHPRLYAVVVFLLTLRESAANYLMDHSSYYWHFIRIIEFPVIFTIGQLLYLRALLGMYCWNFISTMLGWEWNLPIDGYNYQIGYS
jgi:hypothetical protein